MWLITPTLPAGFCWVLCQFAAAVLKIVHQPVRQPLVPLRGPLAPSLWYPFPFFPMVSHSDMSLLIIAIHSSAAPTPICWDMDCRLTSFFLVWCYLWSSCLRDPGLCVLPADAIMFVLSREEERTDWRLGICPAFDRGTLSPQTLLEAFNGFLEAFFSFPLIAILVNSSENTCNCERFGFNHIFLVNILLGKTKQEEDNVL